MSQTGYLIITILVLVALGILALSGFFILRLGEKGKDKKRCKGCQDEECPLAIKLREREGE